MALKNYTGVYCTRKIVETTRVEITEDQLKQIFPDIQIPQNRFQARKLMTDFIQSMQFQRRFQIPGSLQLTSVTNNSVDIFESRDEYDSSEYCALEFEMERENGPRNPNPIILSPTNRVFCFTFVYTSSPERDIIHVEKSE